MIKSLKKQFKSDDKRNKKVIIKNNVDDIPIEGGIFIEPVGQPIIIYRNLDQNMRDLKALAPEEYTGMLTIDYFNYPTIQHYIVAR